MVGGGFAPVPPPPARRGGTLLAAGVVIAIVLAAASLVVSILILNKPAPATSSAPAPSTSLATPESGKTKDADLALCTAVAPLMAESDRITKSFVGAGPDGSPERSAATPQFITDTEDWIQRVQPLLDRHPDVDPYFRRSLQRFIDDRHLLVVDLTPGPLNSYAKALYADSVGAYSGPLHLCYDLGIKW
ncbi:hypothetical protein E3G68_005239 [Mycobacteroides abscessus]|uniref:hypothetical protein n=1 Tax=Mycobacteroides abscessus TaxID=36809 RepID=UPI001C6C4A70|nr:hypothetical protein [Mycobacteroides abscessus]